MASCSFCPRRGPLGGLSTSNNNQQQQPTKQIPLNCMFFSGFSGRTIAPWIVCFVRLAGGAPPTIAAWLCVHWSRDRSQILQVNAPIIALDEIYKSYMLLHRPGLNISAKNRIIFC